MAEELNQEVLKQAYTGNADSVHRLMHELDRLRNQGRSAQSRSILEDLTVRLQQTDAKRAKELAFHALGLAYLRESRLLEASQAFATAREYAEDKSDSVYLSATAYQAYALAESELLSTAMQGQLQSEADLRASYVPIEPPDQTLEAQEAAPKNALKLLSLGLLNYSLKRYEIARSQWQAAVELAGNTAVAYSARLNLVQLDLRTNKVKQAAKQLAELRKAYPENGAAADVLVAESDIYAATTKWADAARVLNEAHGKSPDGPEITYRLGVAYAALADVGKARSYLERTIVIAPWFAKAHTSMAKLDRAGAGPAKMQKIGFLDNRFVRVWLPIALFLASAFVVFYAWNASDGATPKDGVEKKVTETRCPTPVAGTAPSATPPACVPKDETITTTTTAARSGGPPALDASYVAIAAAIAALGVVILLLPYVSKVSIGPVQLERATPSPKAPAG